MTDKAWKPKRAGASSEGAGQGYVVELSVKDPESRSTLEGIIGEIDGVRVSASQGGEPPNLVILELDENPEDTFSVIREMGRMQKGIEVFLTAPTLDPKVLLEAMRAGAKEFLAQPIQKNEVEPAIARFIERATDQSEKNAATKKSGKILAFFGGKGGVGTTSAAVNLASAIGSLSGNPSVVLVDVNQHGGDLPLYLDLQPNHSFRDIAADLSRLDQSFLIRVLTKTESGLQVLPSGYDDLSTGRLNPDCVEATLKLLQANFDYIVIDCGHVLDLTTKKALELSSWILVTSTLIVPVVHRTKRILELLRGSGFPQSKIRLLMNRYLSAEQDVLKETEGILKQKTYWLLPNDYPSVSQSVNTGKSLIEIAPRSAIAKSFKELAQSFDDTSSAKAKKGSLTSWLSPFKSRRSEAAPSQA